MKGSPTGYRADMFDTRDPNDERAGLLEETLWSLGLLAAVAMIIVLLSIIGAG